MESAIGNLLKEIPRKFYESHLPTLLGLHHQYISHYLLEAIVFSFTL